MGSQVFAICKCGINSEIRTGRGFDNKGFIYFPGYCITCKDVVQINLEDDKKVCPKCESENTLPYNDSSLEGTKGTEIIAQCYFDEITNGAYKCPKCENMTLHFKLGPILWD